MGGSERRRSCIEAIETAREAGYAPAAVQESIRSIEHALAGTAAGDRIAAQVGQLLEAGNADRAARLLEQMPLRSRWFVPGLVLACIAAGVGLALVIYSAVSRSVEEAQQSLHASAAGGDPAAAARTDAALAVMETRARAFADDMKHGRVDAAYARMTSAYRSAVPIDRFRAAADNPYFRAATSVAVLRTKSSGGAATVEAVLRTAEGDVAATFHMSSGPDGYALTGVTLGGSPALPGFAP